MKHIIYISWVLLQIQVTFSDDFSFQLFFLLNSLCIFYYFVCNKSSERTYTSWFFNNSLERVKSDTVLRQLQVLKLYYPVRIRKKHGTLQPEERTAVEWQHTKIVQWLNSSSTIVWSTGSEINSLRFAHPKG